MATVRFIEETKLQCEPDSKGEIRTVFREPSGFQKLDGFQKPDGFQRTNWFIGQIEKEEI